MLHPNLSFIRHLSDALAFGHRMLISGSSTFWPDNRAVPPWHAKRTFRRFPNTDNPEREVMLPHDLCSRALTHTKDFSMNTGTVKFYNDQKGFGFIQPDNGHKDVFVHATALERAGMRGLVEGQKVAFDTTEDRRSGKIAVNNIEMA
jgi:CspA family cold shock protein